MEVSARIVNSYNLQLQKNREVIGRSARRLRINAAEFQFARIKRLDKGLGLADRIVLSDPVFKIFRIVRRQMISDSCRPELIEARVFWSWFRPATTQPLLLICAMDLLIVPKPANSGADEPRSLNKIWAL